jgi:hypothetical protein
MVLEFGVPLYVRVRMDKQVYQVWKGLFSSKHFFNEKLTGGNF